MRATGDQMIRRQQARLGHEGVEQLTHDAARLAGHAIDLVVPVQILMQKAL